MGRNASNDFVNHRCYHPKDHSGPLFASCYVDYEVRTQNSRVSNIHVLSISLSPFSFATLSCISSLATAPKLHIWRVHTSEYLANKLATHGGFDPANLTLFSQHVGELLKSEVSPQARHGLKIAQIRERLIFVLSLSAQVRSATYLRSSTDRPHYLGTPTVDVGHYSIPFTFLQSALLQRADATRALYASCSRRRD